MLVSRILVLLFWSLCLHPGLAVAEGQDGSLEQAKECHLRALALAPDHPAAAASLKEMGKSPQDRERIGTTK